MLLHRTLTLRQLEWLAVLAPMAFLGVVYFFVLSPIHPFFHSWYGFVVLAAVLLVAVWFFSRTVFGIVRSLQSEVEALNEQTEDYNRQLVSLHGANLALMRETKVDLALERLVNLSKELLSASHASFALQATEAPAATPDPEAAPADRVLTVPIELVDTPIGTLHLQRAPADAPFTPVDREIARMFATNAALVVQNDRLYDEVQALAVEAERHSLAREMHDSLAQVLSFVNTKAQAVELYLRNEDVNTARQQMAELSAAARDVYRDIREGIAALRVEVGDRAVRDLIIEYAEQFADANRLPVTVTWPDIDPASNVPQLAPAAEVQLLRIVQEALSNVRRHAHAERILVTAQSEGEMLLVCIEDDGRGFEQGQVGRDGWPRFGLQTMAERASSVGGKLTIDSRPGAGTRVTARVPLAERIPAAVSGA
jgi:signal transduction histidine kinase